MIQVTTTFRPLGGASWVYVKSPYSKTNANAFRELGGHWDRDERAWVLADSPHVETALRQMFGVSETTEEITVDLADPRIQHVADPKTGESEQLIGGYVIWSSGKFGPGVRSTALRSVTLTTRSDFAANWRMGSPEETTVIPGTACAPTAPTMTMKQLLDQAKELIRTTDGTSKLKEILEAFGVSKVSKLPPHTWNAAGAAMYVASTTPGGHRGRTAHALIIDDPMPEKLSLETVTLGASGATTADLQTLREMGLRALTAIDNELAKRQELRVNVTCLD